MLSRITRSLTILSPYMQKQRQFVNAQYQIVRLISHTPTFNVANQQENSEDLLFDLGGGSKTTDSTQSSNKFDKRGNKGKDKFADKAKKEKPTIELAKKKPTAKEKLPELKRDRSFEQLKYHDLTVNLTYVKLPFNHPEFPKLMIELKSRKYREKNNLLLIEGKRLALEAIEAGLKIHHLFFSNLKQIEAIREKLSSSLTEQTEIFRVPHNDLSNWSTLTTCPGLVVMFERPNDMTGVWETVRKNTIKKLKTAKATANEDGQNEVENDEHDDKIEDRFNSVPITVICDQIREPNNLGSIIRSCAAIPCSKVILLKGCADPWDVKALRGGCGAQFRVPIVDTIEWENLYDHLPEDVSVFIADNQSKLNDINIPRDEFEEDRKHNNIKFFKPKAYNDIPFHSCKHIALIVGGETEGVSSHALDFLKFISSQTKTNETSNSNVLPDNAIVEIPLGNGVESLNASVATSILLFEMRKQLIQ